MKYSDVPLIDSENTDSLRRRFAQLADSFTPEWRFAPENPDIGSALALIFINQISDNITRLNRLPDKYRTEFANLLGISLLPASPASGIIVAELSSDTVSGIPLPHGTKLLAQSGEGDPLVFETVRDIYVTSSRLTDLIAISPISGKIISIMNGPERATLFSLPDNAPEAENETNIENKTVVPRFALFDFETDGIERNALVMYHKNIFNAVEGISLCVKPVFADGTSQLEQLCDPKKYQWLRLSPNGPVPMDSVTAEGDCIVLTQSESSVSTRLTGTDFFAICLESLQPVQESMFLSDLRICAITDETVPEFALHSSEELDTKKFYPFGETASLFDECYIGHDRIFAQQGTNVRIRFSLSFTEKLVTFTPQKEASELKVIKRKPRAVLFDTVTTSPQVVSLEYFNGLGWKKLVCESDISSLFDGEQTGQFDISFVCPDDWQSITMGGFNSRMLRLRISQADNCYLQPCIHKMPVLSDMKLSCSCGSVWKQPQRLYRICGTRTEELTDTLLSRKPFAAFAPLSYGVDALYFGFDEKMDGAPVSMLFDTSENVLPDDFPLNFEYSSSGGFKSLKVIDGTGSLTRSGTVMFIPPSDFSPMSVEGLSRFWIRLLDLGSLSGSASRFRPVIRRLLLNAAEVRNCETYDEESFYIDSAVPNMVFPLAAENIYSTVVYVSEMPRFSPAAMEQMAHQMPDRVKISYDGFGNITSFFVLWDEVENFDGSLPTDRHYLIDRMNNTITFGDGVHVMIPPSQTGAAFTVRAICCKGQAGNLPVGSVNTLFDNTLFLGNLYNPISTYGGSDLETTASAQERAAWIVSGHGRLVSETDFIREIFAFSDSIEKVRCISGVDIWGKASPGLITIAIMNRDYDEGSYSFTGLRDALKSRLISRCEATISEDMLCLSEPSYVTVSVDVWIQIENVAHYFDAQNLIFSSINAFIDPLGSKSGEGWDIGILPTENQLRQMLHSIRFRGHISKFIATARYVDETGPHETSLEHLPKNPFSIAVNGNHRVFMELQNG